MKFNLSQNPDIPQTDSIKAEKEPTPDRLDFILVDRIKELQSKEVLTQEEEKELDRTISALENMYLSKEQVEDQFKKRSMDLIDAIFDKASENKALTSKAANEIAESLAGLDSADAWAIREILWRQVISPQTAAFPNLAVDPESIAIGLAGLDSEKAWKWREDWIKDGWGSLALLSLVGLDSEKTWEVRDKLNRETSISSLLDRHLAISIAGLDSERAWKLREQFQEQYLVMSLIGLDSDRAWKIREEYLGQNPNENDKAIIVRSVSGLDSERAWKLREDAMGVTRLRSRIAMSLVGLDTNRAWAMRANLAAKGTHRNDIARGLGGLNSEEAWAWRDADIQKSLADGHAIARGIYGDWVMIAIKKAKETQV